MEIKLNGVKNCVSALQATPRQIDKACSRAVRTTTRDIRREDLTMTFQRSTGIKRAELNKRLHLRFNRENGK